MIHNGFCKRCFVHGISYPWSVESCLVADCPDELYGCQGYADEDWRDLALCAETDPEAFFPAKGGSTRQAKAVCASCEVRRPCLEYALEHQVGPGIWGGLSERERRRLKREQAAA